MLRVAAGVLEKNSRILIARRGKGAPHGGMWEFPGGKLEPGETPEECLKREFLEEFGVEVRVNGFIASSVHSYDHLTVELLAYKVSYISGEFSAREHEEIRWITPGELKEYDLLEADIPIAVNLMKDVYHVV